MFEVIVKKNLRASHALCHVACGKEKPHEHDWTIEARIRSDILGGSGCVIDFNLVDRALREITGPCEGKLINDLDPFKKTEPSAENFAKWVFEKLSVMIETTDTKLVSVTAWEDEKHGASYLK